MEMPVILLELKAAPIDTPSKKLWTPSPNMIIQATVRMTEVSPGLYSTSWWGCDWLLGFCKHNHQLDRLKQQQDMHMIGSQVEHLPFILATIIRKNILFN